MKTDAQIKQDVLDELVFEPNMTRPKSGSLSRTAL